MRHANIPIAIVVLTSIACSLGGAPSPAPTPAVIVTPTIAALPTSPPLPAPTTMPTGTAAPSATPTRIAPAVEATMLNGKVIFGYQGWFSCPTDGSGLGIWVHWTQYSSTFRASDLTVDNWPDISDIPLADRCATDMKLPDGNTAEVFSSYSPAIIDLHFKWMEQYGIDGVALQRFVAGLDDPRFFAFRNQVLKNVRASAETHGRIYYIEYDASGQDGVTLFNAIKADWAYLVDNLKVTSDPQYLHDNGRPVIQIFGMGLSDYPQISADQAQQIIDWFKSDAPDQYRATIIGGEPSYWRTGTRDAFAGAAWAKVYRSFDVVSPWSVGRYANNAEADQYRREVIAPDLIETAKHQQRYLPVIFPGFSWINLNHGPLNEIPRQCGKFYWHQVYNALHAGSKMIFVAMFDEMDEGTAMFKLAPTKQQTPEDANLVSLDIDGCALPSDWYLRLGGATGSTLRGALNLSANIPIKPN